MSSSATTVVPKAIGSSGETPKSKSEISRAMPIAASRPTRAADRGQLQRLADDERLDAARVGAERDAQADLARAPRDRERRHAVESNRRKQQRD